MEQTILFHDLGDEIGVQGLTDECLDEYFEMVLMLGRASGWGQLRLVQQDDVSVPEVMTAVSLSVRSVVYLLVR